MYYAGLFNQASKAMVAIYRALPAELHQDAGAEGRAAGISPFTQWSGQCATAEKGVSQAHDVITVPVMPRYVVATIGQPYFCSTVSQDLRFYRIEQM